ncbi:shikimate kinase [Candidatus Woesearchaeota archaeon]|nr:shikimate kinase [Candidatus Woesearchaeota archaeon]
MNITLIGFRGTGKTTIARILAQKLGKKLISTDDEIAKKMKMNAASFAKKHSLDKLRELESDVIEYVSDFDECVFDTGSSIVMRNENIINLKKNSLIVMLTADISTIKNRLKKNRTPSGTINFFDEIKGAFYEHEARCKRAADYAIDTSRLNPEEACDLIAHYLLMEMQ